MAFDHGPCLQWVSRSELDDWCPDCVGDTVASLALAQACLDEATEQLYILTARMYPGECERTVYWCSPGDCGVSCCASCSNRPGIPLDGPGAEVSEVSYNGTVIPSTDYAITQDNMLIPTNRTHWPTHTTLDDNAAIEDQFTITYTFGAPPPLAAKRAVKDLACQMIQNVLLMPGCRISTGATTLSALGTSVSIDPAAILAAEIGSVRTLMQLVNPLNERVPTTVYSPDTDPDLFSLS